MSHKINYNVALFTNKSTLSVRKSSKYYLLPHEAKHDDIGAIGLKWQHLITRNRCLQKFIFFT